MGSLTVAVRANYVTLGNFRKNSRPGRPTHDHAVNATAFPLPRTMIEIHYVIRIGQATICTGSILDLANFSRQLVPALAGLQDVPLLVIGIVDLMVYRLASPTIRLKPIPGSAGKRRQRLDLKTAGTPFHL